MTPDMEASLQLAGFASGTNGKDYEEMPAFWSYRLGDFNVIVTRQPDFYQKFVAATEEAKARNLTDKSARISLFQKMLYNNTVEELQL
jgi:hypothetical protein